MKNVLIIAVMLLGFACSDKTTVSSTGVPDEVVASFNNRYPDAKDVTWKMNNDGLYEVQFEDGTGKNRDVFYRSDGDLVRVDK